MSDTRAARLFKNGNSQAVRLPADFRFDCDEVYISRDPSSGDVVLSSRPGGRTWEALLALVHSNSAPAEFLYVRPMNAPL